MELRMHGQFLEDTLSPCDVLVGPFKTFERCEQTRRRLAGLCYCAAASRR